jgi:hypothetical protein
MLPHIDSVLYYPTIEFQSDAWLKSSLLLWDSIYRIVPRGYSPKDTDAVKLARDEGLVKSIIIEKQDLSQVSSEFATFLKDLPFIPAGLEDYDYTSRLNIDKIESRLYPVLSKYITNYDPEGWLELPREIAHGYMIFLAKSVSGRRNLATVSDNRDVWAITPYFKENANFKEEVYDLEAPGYYTSLVFNDIVPANVGFVQTEKVIEFVRKRKDERRRLRQSIQDFSQSLQLCSSKEHLRSLIHDYENQIRQAKADYRNSMGFLNEEQRFSLFTVGLPMTLSFFSVAAMFGDPYDFKVITSSVFMGAVAAYLDYGKKKQVIQKKSQVSYLVDIDEELIERHAIPIYHRSFEEFIND